MSETTLSEAASRAIVAEAGVAVSAYITATSADDAVDRASALTYPVVAKLCGDAIAHKTERGLVRLKLRDEEELRSAAVELLAAARPEDGPVEVLVSSMVDGNRELIAGLIDDPQFGMCVMLGVGGILAEAIEDVAFRLAPITKADAIDLIDDLRTQTLFGDFRGEPQIDRDALANTLVALASLAAQPAINAVDLNPLIVVDGRPVAVDALVVRND